MLREYIPTRQVPGDPRRRWFASPQCDLIVWFREDQTVLGFQFCYDKDATEHAITWVADRGFNHMRVDTEGGEFAHGRGVPLLMANAVFDPDRILEIFRAECQFIPKEFVKLVSEKLREVAERSQELE